MISSDVSNNATSRTWLVAVATCKFDLDAGQTVENVHPVDALTQEEQRDISCNSFPESSDHRTETRSYVADCRYFFRIRRRKNSPIHTSSTNPLIQYSFLYCFVFSRQRCDPRLTRGAERRSAVLISEYPYNALLLPLVTTLGPSLLFAFDSLAPKLLRDASHTWPAPSPSCLVRLTVGPEPITGTVPADACLPQAPFSPPPFPTLSSTSSLSAFLRASSLNNMPSLSATVSGIPRSDARQPQGVFADANLYQPLKAHLKFLWPLWEIMLLAQPLMVFSRLPEDCSSVIAALVSLVNPLPYSADFRPLLSVQDEQVQEILAGVRHTHEHPVPTAYGVTNPFFLRAQIPNVNIVSLPSPCTQGSSTSGASPRALHHSASSKPSTSNVSVLPTLSSLIYRTSSDIVADCGAIEGIMLTYNGRCKGSNQEVLAALKQGAQSSMRKTPSLRSESTNSNLLRAHFYDLTTAFLEPFTLYCGVFPPWADDASAAQMSAELEKTAGTEGFGEFEADQFLVYLEEQGVHELVLAYTGSHESALLLYADFMESPNFKPWLLRTLDNV